MVENRPGGDAVIAINAFIGAKDDHTLLYTPTSSFTAHPFQHAKMPYDPAELGPIARVSNTLVGLVVTPSLKIDSVKDLVAQIKAQPGKLNYATATGMTDVIFDGYFKNAGLNITRVPYRDVVRADHRSRRRTHPGLCRRARDRAAAHPVRPGQADRRHQQPARADASRIRRRSREAGFPALTFDGLIGLFGPRDMPQALRDRIAADVKEVLADPTVASRLTATGQVVSPGTGAEFAASIGRAARQARAQSRSSSGVKPQ